MIDIENAIKYLTKDYEESDSTAAFMLCTRWALKDVLELQKEQQKEKERNPVIVCPHCGKRVK